MILPLLFLVAGIARHIAAVNAPAEELYSPLIPPKLLSTARSLPQNTQYPQYTTTNGVWRLFSPRTWTSSFLPVTLYALDTRKTLCGANGGNQLGLANWRLLGQETGAAVGALAVDRSLDHDVGFLSYPFIEELKVNPYNETATRIVNDFATTLAGRYNSKVGCTRSWDTSDLTDFTVIIDNMMNLEVLLWSAALTGNGTLQDIANSHATTTMNNHIRDDGSTWHVIEYNSTTGQVIKKRTAQGYSDSSTWSRGQAWGVYGFANMYNWTHNPDYLNTSRKLATFFISNIPSDGIVPWDFNAPVTQRPADSSAASIIATALLYLAKIEPDSNNAKKWKASAVRILNNMTKLAWRASWQSLLSNGTVNRPNNNFLTGTVYGDYYFVVAGNELIKMGMAKCL